MLFQMMIEATQQESEQNMASKIRKTRVSLTSEEKSKVVKNALELYFNDQRVPLTFIAKAQENILAPDRQRAIVGRNGVGVDVIQEFFNRRREILETGIPYPVTIEKVELVQPSRESLLASVTNEEFLRLFSSKLLPIIELIPLIVTKLGQDIPNKQEIAATTQGSHEMKTSKTLKVRKPKVLLCGFLKGQESVILEKSRPFELDLRFHPLGRQREAPPSCQWCIVLNKIGHPTWGRLKNRFGDRIRLVEGIDGTMSELTRINSLACSGVY
jgi:hypothetical protein